MNGLGFTTNRAELLFLKNDLGHSIFFGKLLNASWVLIPCDCTVPVCA
jgi:hypothetical protein